MLFLNLILFIISSIPFIDIYLTSTIYKIPLHSLSRFVSKYIIYLNYIVRGILLYYYFYKTICCILIDLLIINFLFKWMLDRKRPKYSLLINNSLYESIYSLKCSAQWEKNQSFPSGHVATIFGTVYLLNSIPIFYILGYILLLITIFSRINLGTHHLSDTLGAITIYQITILMVNYINII